MFSRIATALALVVVAMSPAAASAYEVKPMRILLTPDRGQQSGSITVTNTREEELLYEVKVLRRSVAPDGQQQFTPAEDAFTVFPPQGALAANRSQGIRFQYVGPPVTDLTEAYVIQIAEVPVVKPGFSGVRFAYNFGVAVYVRPGSAKADLSVASVVRSGEVLKLEVVNRGNDYALITEQSLTLEASGTRVQLGKDQLMAAVENPIIPPRAQRSFEIKVADIPAVGPVTAELRPARR